MKRECVTLEMDEHERTKKSTLQNCLINYEKKGRGKGSLTGERKKDIEWTRSVTCLLHVSADGMQMTGGTLKRCIKDNAIYNAARLLVHSFALLGWSRLVLIHGRFGTTNRSHLQGSGSLRRMAHST